MKALETQVGGKHYVSAYQPVELFAKLKLNAFQANIVKYVTRHRHKNGIEDIEKAIHYCDLGIELRVLNPGGNYIEFISEIEAYALLNNLNELEKQAIGSVCVDGLQPTRLILQNILSTYETT